MKATYDITIKKLTAETDVKSADGGDLILTEAGASEILTFSVSYAVPDVQVQAADAIGNVVKTWQMGTLAAETPTTVTWDLTNANGGKVSAGNYCFQIVAAGTTIKSDYFVVYARSEFGSGNGSAASPYIVSTLEHLQKVAFHNGVCFKQTADIDLNLKDFTPLFTKDVPFTGTYDGGSFAIKNINSSSDDKVTKAIFRSVGKDGVLQNIVVQGCTFTNNADIAALVVENAGTIIECTVRDCTLITKDGRLGLITAYNTGTIKGCKSENNVGNGSGYGMNVGGIAARNTLGNIMECTSTGNNAGVSTDNSYVGELNQTGN